MSLSVHCDSLKIKLKHKILGVLSIGNPGKRFPSSLVVCPQSNQIFWTWWSKGGCRKPAICQDSPVDFYTYPGLETRGISVNNSIHSTIIYWAPTMHQVQTKPKSHMDEWNQRGSLSAWSQVKWYIWKEVAQSCPTLWDHGTYSPWNSPGQNTGVGNLSLLQGISPT